MNKWLLYAGLVLAGVVFSGQIRKLPVLDKLPAIG